MKQVLQDLRSGGTTVVEVPCPAPAPGALQVATSRSLVSAGTERMLVAFARASLLGKARQQPERVREVFEKVRAHGVRATVEAVRTRLEQPLALGYCNVGRVLEVGAGVSGFEAGERVVSNGKHAEVVVVQKNLCARVPDGVDDDSAVFTVLAAIGLQGVRLVVPTVGECVVVIGLGLIGLITVQILRANGCRVLGVDPDPARLRLAKQFGAEVVGVAGGGDPLEAARRFSRDRGVDAVVITASTPSSEPISQAATMARKRARIVLVGVTGLELSRADFYEKELSFQVSCSYGPGRYDPGYEQGGNDYPVGFVRWTAQRNFEAVLDLMASGALEVKSLISHRFDIGSADKAYDILASSTPSLGIILDYPPRPQAPGSLAPVARTVVAAPAAAAASPRLAFIGAGNYAGRVLIPAFRASGASLHTVVSASGVSAAYQAKRRAFTCASTDAGAAIHDPNVDAVVVATRHDSHARYALEALQAGKSVFVEKPLCLTTDELTAVAQAAAAANALLMVGFNRRFAPHVVRMKALLAAVPGPKALVMTVNAGAIPAVHWTQDPDIGGGRLLGEGCHFVDLLRHLVGAPIVAHDARLMDAPTRDSASIVLSFADGSIGTIHYFANGGKGFPKERLEVFTSGRVLRLDDFRRLTGFSWPGFSRMTLWRQDKGQHACARAFVEAVRGGAAPIPLAEIVEVSFVSIAIGRSVR